MRGVVACFIALLLLTSCSDVKTAVRMDPAPYVDPAPTTQGPPVDHVVCYANDRIYFAPDYPVLIVHDSVECGGRGNGRLEWL